MTLALALSAAIAGWSVGIAMWLRGRSDRYDRLITLDALARAEKENASLRTRLTRKPAARAQAQAMRVARTNELASGPVAPLEERVA